MSFRLCRLFDPPSVHDAGEKNGQKALKLDRCFIALHRDILSLNALAWRGCIVVPPSCLYAAQYGNFYGIFKQSIGRYVWRLLTRHTSRMWAESCFLVACFATLHPALTVRPLLFGQSDFTFFNLFIFCCLLPHCSCPNTLVISNISLPTGHLVASLSKSWEYPFTLLM